jgi:hypothetical protein
MLWADLLGEEVVLVKKPPELVVDKQARPKERAEVPHLGQRGSGGLGHPVLDVPGGGHEVRCTAVVVLFLVNVIEAEVILYYCGGHGEGGGGGGRGGEDVVFTWRNRQVTQHNKD